MDNYREPQRPDALVDYLPNASVEPFWPESQPYEDWRVPGRPRERPRDPFADLLMLVGDAQALATLDTKPLPDEPFDWNR